MQNRGDPNLSETKIPARKVAVKKTAKKRASSSITARLFKLLGELFADLFAASKSALKNLARRAPKIAAENARRAAAALKTFTKTRAPRAAAWLQRALSHARARFAVPLRNTALAPAVYAAAALFFAGAAYYAWAVHRPLPGLEARPMTIARGDTLGRIAARLESREIIGETFTLKLHGRLSRLDKRIQAGEYEFPPGTSLRQFLRRIASGRGRVNLRIAIIEGWTFARMREHLRAAPDLRQDTADMSARDIMALLGHPDLHPEGRFAPDTYHYAAGASDLAIYRAAFALQRERLEAIWRDRAGDLSFRERAQALILASIIEKESPHAGEQRRISGVFHNRLRKGMRLQADPTVIYGVGEAFDGDITRKHLRTDTPYNTYTRRGLPPTPVSLPGESSLRAAVQPQKTDAYYFVAKGGGRHHFSATLKQHNRAVRKYARKSG